MNTQVEAPASTMHAVPRTGAHTEFLGWTVTIADEDFSFTFPVVAAAPGSLCDLCDAGTVDHPTNQAAEYKVDATSELGEAGSDALYCHRHLRDVVEIHGVSHGEVWAFGFPGIANVNWTAR